LLPVIGLLIRADNASVSAGKPCSDIGLLLDLPWLLVQAGRYPAG
jgi:hypothetical protein